MSRPAADAVCLFERDTGFESFRPPAWAGRYSPDRFAVQAYQVDAAAKNWATLCHESDLPASAAPLGHAWNRLPGFTSWSWKTCKR